METFALRKECEFRGGDCFGEVALMKPSHVSYTVIAAEDTHIVSFTRHDYKMLFSEENDSIKAKVDFITQDFPGDT